MVAVVVMVVLAGAPDRAVDGGLSLAHVAEVLAWRAPEASCLPAKKGLVRYGFGVSAEGKVEHLAFKDSKGVEPRQSTCVGAALEQLRFPEADGGTSVEWTFVSGAPDAGVPEALTPTPEEVPERWRADVALCFDARVFAEGPLSLELVIARSGFVLEVGAIDAPAGPRRDDFVDCLRSRAWRWQLPEAQTVRQVSTRWTLGKSERAVKRFFVPERLATEIYPELLGELPILQGPGGGLERAVLQQTILGHSSRVRACYELALRRRFLEGKLTVQWVIGPEGRVTSAEVETPLDDDLDACVLGVVRAMTFPPPTGGGKVNVTFPWIFKTAGSD